MNLLNKKFIKLKKQNKKALSIFITAGYPDFDFTQKLIFELEKIRVDIIEIGIPFSDPIADGPVIQKSSYESLKKGTSLKKVLRFICKIKNRISIPIVIMSYLNPINKYGMSKFFSDARKAGVDGIIIPDIIFEESREIETISRKYNIPLIYLVAPTTSIKRRKEILKKSKGFIYVVSVTGVTGPREKLPEDLQDFLKNLRNSTKKPLMLGFGISRPQQIIPVKKYIDGIIIGSAIIRIISKTRKKEVFDKIENFINSFRKVLKNGK